MGKEKEFVEKLSKTADLLKLQVFSKNLLDLDAKREAYDKNAITFTDYCSYLAKLGSVILSPSLRSRISFAKDLPDDKADPSVAQNEKFFKDPASYPNFTLMIESLEIEKKIDAKKIDIERKDLISELQKKMVKEELSELVKQSLLLRTGKITSEMFYAYLKDAAAAKKIDLSKYHDLAGYMEIVFKNSKVSAAGLFDEVSKLEKAVKGKLFASGEERELDETIGRVKVLKNLLDLRMSRKDLSYYEEHKDEITPEKLVSKLKEIAKRSRRSDAIPGAPGWQFEVAGLDFSPCTNFYDAALKRDKVLVENTIREMEKRKAQAAAFVTGGFHTQGAKELFKAKGYSYVVVTPRMTQKYDDKIYLSRMLNEQTELDKLFANSGNRLAAWTKFQQPGGELNKAFMTMAKSLEAMEKGSAETEMTGDPLVAKIKAVKTRSENLTVTMVLQNGAETTGEVHMLKNDKGISEFNIVGKISITAARQKSNLEEAKEALRRREAAAKTAEVALREESAKGPAAEKLSALSRAEALENLKQAAGVEEQKDAAAYLGEGGQEEINPQVAQAMRTSAAFRIYDAATGQYGVNDEGMQVALSVPAAQEELLREAMAVVVRNNPALEGFKIAVVAGADFSGHYGRSRQRVYLPAEILEIAAANPALGQALIEDFIEHEYLESTGIPHDDVVKALERKRPGLHQKAKVAYKLYRAKEYRDRPVPEYTKAIKIYESLVMMTKLFDTAGILSTSGAEELLKAAKRGSGVGDAVEVALSVPAAQERVRAVQRALERAEVTGAQAITKKIILAVLRSGDIAAVSRALVHLGAVVPAEAGEVKAEVIMQLLGERPANILSLMTIDRAVVGTIDLDPNTRAEIEKGLKECDEYAISETQAFDALGLVEDRKPQAVENARRWAVATAHAKNQNSGNVLDLKTVLGKIAGKETEAEIMQTLAADRNKIRHAQDNGVGTIVFANQDDIKDIPPEKLEIIKKALGITEILRAKPAALNKALREAIRQKGWQRPTVIAHADNIKYLEDVLGELAGRLLIADAAGAMKLLDEKGIKALIEAGLGAIAQQIRDGKAPLLDILDIGTGTIDEGQEAYQTLGFQA